MGLKLVIVSPENQLYNGNVDRVELPGSKGRFEVLINHAPLVSSLTSGRITYYDLEGKEHIKEILGGFVEIKNNIVSVCVEI